VGWIAKGASSVIELPELWPEGELPRSPAGITGKNFKSLRYPLWMQNKARLIQAYLQLFEFITHHGTYIDGFAAPQDKKHPDMWTSKLVLEMMPKWFHDFWLCDLKPAGVKALTALQTEHTSSTRRVNVLEGDFNEKVYEILKSGQITERTATFALLDQRTFECEWRTVEALSCHKCTGNKIEIFYLLATGWIDRSLGAVRKPETREKVDRWWGRTDWRELLGMDGTARAQLVANRFEKELGFRKAAPYPIHSERRGGRVMYHMIHATDHPEAFSLMVRAYHKISGRPDIEVKEEQRDLLDGLLREIQSGADDTAKLNGTGSSEVQL
jgi:three-Cys-motif partner protein